MPRPTSRLAGSIATAVVILAALLIPAAALAYGPVGAADASVQTGEAASGAPTGEPSPTPTGSVSIDPTFIPAPTPTTKPVGSVLGATARPYNTTPPTDTTDRAAPAAASTPTVALLLLGLATTSVLAAFLSGVRRR